jgi:hypothetical protein
MKDFTAKQVGNFRSATELSWLEFRKKQFVI